MNMEYQMKKRQHASVGGDSCERSERYGDTKRSLALLDHNDIAGFAGSGDPQVEMNLENHLKKRSTQASGETHVSAANDIAARIDRVRYRATRFLPLSRGLANLRLG